VIVESVPSPSSLLEFLNHTDGPWADSSLAESDFDLYRTGYLSSMFRCRAGDRTYLVNLKHHDPNGSRAIREFEVLTALDGSIAPRAYALDNSKTWFSDPVLVTDFVQPEPIHSWDHANLNRLASLMASIHTDRRLLKLSVDSDGPSAYSIKRELADEVRDLPTFRASPLKDELTSSLDMLSSCVDEWEKLFQHDPLAYVHSDLPHHHLFENQREWRTIHWEWSRRSHPTRELARAFWDLEMEPEFETYMLERYAAHSHFSISPAALEVQRILQYFYNAIHVAFWLDRVAPMTHPDWETATKMAKVVSLWTRMETQKCNWKTPAQA